MIALTDEVRGCLAQVGEGLDDGLLLVDHHGTVHLSNRTARGLLDLASGEPSLAPVGLWQGELLDLLQRLPAEGCATEVHVSGAAPLVFEGYAVEQDGEFWGGIFVARSAAVRRREMAGSRATEFAHEVKNALHSLLLNLYMLRKWAASQPYVETQTLAKFELLSSEIHRLNGLAEDFMPDARPRVRRESVRLSPLLEEIVSRLAEQAREAGIEIRTRLPGDLPPFQGDARLLKDAFQALLENRLAALPQGGAVEVLAGVGSKDAFVIISDKALGHAGHGPAATEDLASRPGGGGRGLGITEWVVRGHGGSVETFSAAGLGMTFLVKLPLSGTPPSVAEPDIGLIREA